MGASAEKIKGTDDENDDESHRLRRRLLSFRKRGIFMNPKDKQNKASCSTTLYDLPFELLDIILQKSYMYRILNSPTKQRDEEVIRSLISVDVCFYQRITRKRFKREIWRYLIDCYKRGKKKHSEICRNNKEFLMKNIQPNDEFMDSLLSHDCITEEQSQFIKRQHSNRDKNAELLQVVRSFDDKQFKNFAICLRQTNQTKVAAIVKNGGVVCSIYINFTKTIKMRGIVNSKIVCGVTTLRNEIYVLCQMHNFPKAIICVFENRDPFGLQKKIEIDEISDPVDIASSEKENCLYVLDYNGNCIWKLTIETDYKYKIIKWITTDYKVRGTDYISERTLTVTSDEQLLLVDDTSSILRIYGSNRKLIRFILLPEDIKRPLQAVETSIGNFVILHYWTEYRSETKKVEMWEICEVSRDGQTIIRRFIPSNETQQLYNTKYISIDSDDRVFVADYENNRVILLDSNLKWNRILLSRNVKTKETKIRWPSRLCYDAEKKQMIVVDDHNHHIKLFTVST